MNQNFKTKDTKGILAYNETLFEMTQSFVTKSYDFHLWQNLK